MKKLLSLTLIFVLALQSGVPARMLASESESGENMASDADLSAGDVTSDVLTGIQVIDGEFYCYSEDGELDRKKTDELRETARAESDITPLLKLIGEPDEEEYFGQGCWFGASGKESGEDGTWYYDNFLIYVYKTKDITYYMGAGALKNEKTDFQSMLAALVESEAGTADDPEVRLKALFRYVEEEYSYARKMGFEAYDGWQEGYAYEMISDMAGSCYHYAALYGFLAKEATDYDVRICIGTTGGFSATSWQPHAWTEVRIDGKWYVFDTNLDKYEADSGLKFYRLDTESDDYRKLYKVENTYEVAFETTAAGEAEPETETEILTAAELQEETETEDASDSETEVMTEAETEYASEAETEVETEPETENESAEEPETETETEASETSTELKVDEEGEDVLVLDNRTGLVFKEAHLAKDAMTLIEEDGTEHRFSEVEKEDIKSPHLVVYGNFLAIKYTSAKTGKAGRLTEDGDEIVFDVPQTMTVISTAYVRSGAGLDCDKLSVADKGTSIKVIAESGKWFRISLRDGREGYISKVAVIVEEKLPAEGAKQGESETESETETEPVPELVVVEEDGEYYRYLRFTPAEDTIVKIDGKPCYVTAGGALSEGWKVLGDKLYYSESDGQLKCSGTYEGVRFGRNGAALDSTNTRLKMKVIQIVDSITDDTMTQREELSACWKYVIGHVTYAGKYPDLNEEGWQRSMALNVLSSGSGNCYGFACAFAALAEGIGYEPEVVCGRVSGSRDGAADGMTRHSWVMINGYHYDPEAQWAGWCAGIYGYGSYPVTHSVQKIVKF